MSTDKASLGCRIVNPFIVVCILSGRVGCAVWVSRSACVSHNRDAASWSRAFLFRLRRWDRRSTLFVRPLLDTSRRRCVVWTPRIMSQRFRRVDVNLGVLASSGQYSPPMIFMKATAEPERRYQFPSQQMNQSCKKKKVNSGDDSGDESDDE